VSVDRFLIANTRIGMEKDLEPFLLPNDAYPDLEDCYLFRGRVKKRDGYRLLGRLNRQIGTTDGTGHASITLQNIPLNSGISSFIVGAEFFQDGGAGGTLLTNGPGSANLNLASGLLTITGAPINTAIFYFPGLPVLGLQTEETITINQTSLVAFDQAFAYLYNNSSSKFVDASFYKTTLNVVNWTGPNYQQFYTSNYADALWATNFNAGFQGISEATTAASGDGIRWFDEDQSGWVNFLPPITGANTNGTGTTYLMGCLIIVPYKNRLVCLNTIEGSSYSTSPTLSFQQRARWSQNGTPYNTKDQSTGNAPKPTNFQGGQDSKNQAWSSDVVGKGGYIDAPTNEAIVAAEFVKDTLIVYFERSTWNLRYTGNELLPFIWEKINTELGSESTFSTVPFDAFCIGMGNVGIHACDTVNVQRIDDKIPDDVFEIEQANNGPQRVSGIRDFLNELVYWAMPIRTYNSESDVDSGETITFPNKMLVYNYREQCFSYFNDSFTSLGYIEAVDPGTNADLTWQNASMTWQSADFFWISPIQDSQVVRVLGGNQQGFVELLQEQVSNGDGLFISNVTLPGGGIVGIFSPNHNLTSGNFVFITNASGITGLNGNIYEISVPLIGAPLAPDPNNFNLILPAGNTVTGTFTGSGTIQVVNNISILTKKFNPYMSEGIQSRIKYVDFYFDTTVAGAVTVNLYINEDTTIPVNAPTTTNANLSTNVVNTFPESTYQASPDTSLANSKLWKRIYFEDISQLYQFEITLNPSQMVNETIRESDIVLHGILMYFDRAGRLIDV
jgi:hypothetical protein